MRLLVIVLLILFPCAAPAMAQDDLVLRRGAEPPVRGTITEVDFSDAGVFVRSSSGARHFIPWDHVRRVVTDRPHPRFDEWMKMAEHLWRARSRVERGDTALAEELFVRLFEQYRSQTHETSLVVAEGLLRCRLSRGANAAAVIPALEVARLRRADVITDSYSALPPVIDEETSLCPQLPPAWVSDRALARLQRDLAAYDAKGDEVVSAIAALYMQAARRQLGVEAEQQDSPSIDASVDGHGGVHLLSLLVSMSASEDDERRAARRRAVAELESLPDWARAWARFAIGDSLLREIGVGRQQRGMVSLLHLPARYARSQPYLAGLALAWAARAARDHGDTDTASILEAELARRFPNHPVRTAPASAISERTKDVQ